MFPESRACVLPLAAAVCIGFAGLVTTAFGAVALVALSVSFVFDRHHILGDYTGYRSSGQGRGVSGFMHFLPIHPALSVRRLQGTSSSTPELSQAPFACGRAGGGRFYLRRFVCETDTF
ncbi:hypothetical protein PO124_20415 [Bacillus licheniformis]|nr:hypothetical protein [Bacillus licheniformis]